ncbi:MAG: hypothetical protein E7168_01155 [Firmicutes bacterium]|nr:hypothetical protein [Bacillota bacterium]
MKDSVLIKDINIIKYNKRIQLEIAIILNRELLNENKISYKNFKYTEENLLKDLKKDKIF